MQHISQAKLSLATLLTAQLPTLLTDADQRFPDGTVTPPPAELHRTEKLQFDAYPAMVMVVRSSLPQGDTHAQIYRHTLNLGVAVAGDDEQTLTNQIEKYVWAMRQVLRDAVLDPSVGTAQVDTGQEAYTLMDPQTGVEFPFVKGAWLEVFVTTVGESFNEF